MTATVPHVTSGLGLRKFQADRFSLTRVYKQYQHLRASSFLHVQEAIKHLDLIQQQRGLSWEKIPFSHIAARVLDDHWIPAAW